MFIACDSAPNVFSKFRTCVHCGDFLNLFRINSGQQQPQICCQVCAGELLKTKNSNWRHDYDFKTLSLFSWTSENEKLVKKIVQGLKGGGPKEIFETFALELCKLRLELQSRDQSLAKSYRNFLKENIFVVPAPGRDPASQDHAETLAASIADNIGAKYLPVLRRATTAQQKTKDQKARQESVIKRLGKNEACRSDYCQVLESNNSNPAMYIFVDDIITTGNTALSAYNALGRPVNFEVWTIFNRVRLRDQ